MVTPLCSSTHAAACWSSSTFAGQRPWSVLPTALDPFSPSPNVDTLASDRDSRNGRPVASILHPSTLIAPVPCARTFLATVFSARGLRARTIGSNALRLAAAPVVAVWVAELAPAGASESSPATCASADATASAIPSVAVAGTEALRVCSHLAHSSLELDATLGAGDDGPPRRHPHLGMVVCDVIGPSSEFKVLKAVVVLDAVDVVDVLVLAESAPNVAFHDEAMFEDVEASAGELNVAV